MALTPKFKTSLGKLYEGDCGDILSQLEPESVDLIFADPPFNLKKQYGPNSDDALSEADYISWCKSWIDKLNVLAKNGASIFIYNIPKWNIILGAYMMSIGLEFRHSIAIEHKSSLPIRGRLYPAHYSLLYFSKGKPNRFQRIRTPIETCRHCGGEVKDYGGHRSAMNPNGVTLKDVWTDIPPVRHRKFKSEKRKENALSTKLLERVVEMASYPGDLVLDPFGGSGTTFAVCESKQRRWIGIEIEDTSDIINRLQRGQVESHRNSDYVELAPENPQASWETAAE